MRIISLVPSWTETLVLAGANVVGRTRYCIHPQDLVQNIPIVGGTKHADFGKIAALKPDLLILDQEENPISFTTASTVPWLATHVQDVGSMLQEMRRIGGELKLARMRDWAAQGEPCLQPLTVFPRVPPGSRENLSPVNSNKICYVIWRDPWMVVGAKTYIGSVLENLGATLAPIEGTYPQVDEKFLRQCCCLFSSEPYPFAQHKADIAHFGGFMVDGESYSWFGIRGLRFLLKQRGVSL